MNGLTAHHTTCPATESAQRTALSEPMHNLLAVDAHVSNAMVALLRGRAVCRGRLRALEEALTTHDKICCDTESAPRVAASEHTYTLLAVDAHVSNAMVALLT